MRERITLVALVLFANLLMGYFPAIAQPTGSVTGIVSDAETQSPLAGANVMLEGTDMGSATDNQGRFKISNVPVGSYTIIAEYIGYKTVHIPDVIVKSERQTQLTIEMQPSVLNAQQVTVTGGYFSHELDEPASVTAFSNEEIRRAPGSGGDVSRILMSLPSIAKVNDQSNSLIVRGGNPMENAFYVDNIQVPNINHFPDMASSGGPIGMVNVDFIDDVSFYSGGFPVSYGNVLSSVMDIDFRSGNREEFYGQVDLNFAGFGGTFEGPLPKKSGAWMFSVRRSYLDFIVETLDVGSTVAPSYGDIQGKLVFVLNQNHRLSVIALYGDDHNSPDREIGRENKMLYYGSQDIYQGTTGMNWRALWNKLGYSNTSLAYTSERFKEDWYETNTGLRMTQNHALEQAIKFRNVNHLIINSTINVDFGIESKLLRIDYDNYYAGMTGVFGEALPDVILKENDQINNTRVFASVSVKPSVRFEITAGISSLYFSYAENWTHSPRISTSYSFNDRTSLTGSVGVYHQSLPMLLLTQNEKHRNLDALTSTHYVAGLELLLTEDTRLTIELYRKEYSDFPMDQDRPKLFVIDDDRYSNFGSLTDQGAAYSQGIEFVLQKKLARKFYGLASLSYFRSRYKDLDGVWRNRKYDNRIIASIDGGFKPNSRWEFSMRWLFAGGPPFTPIDEEASRQVHRTVYRDDRVNESRYPDYHSMNIRTDRRFNFHHTNLVVYLSVWNVYDRKNVATYFWNDADQKVDVIYQWRVLPIFGVEYEW